MGNSNGPRTADRSRWDFVGRGGPKGLGLAIFMPPKLVGDFFVFEPTLRNGVFVAAGDLNGDGKAEVVFGGGPGGGPRVMALDGAAVVRGQQTPVVNIFDDMAGAYSWLQHTRFAHLDAVAPLESERQAELASRVAELSEGLRRYRKVARLSVSPQRQH